MQIIVTRVSGVAAGRQLTVDVESDWTVDRLKEKIEEDHGIPVATQLLTFNAVKLLTGTQMCDYKLFKEAGLQLAERPVGVGRHAEEQGSLDKQIAHIYGVGDGLRARWLRLGAAKVRLDEQKQALQLRNGGGQLQKKLKLNVGGTLFDVRRKVFCDAVPESHLAEIFSGRWEAKLLTDRDGLPFLDVCPVCFDAIVAFLKARLKDKHCTEVPVVPEEYVPALHRMLDHFGLGHLFVEQADMEQEPEAEPEPRAEEGDPPGDAAAGEGRAQVEELVEEREHRAAENEQVALPAKSIDYIIKARYGALDVPGKWVDVTRVLSDMVDEDGGLAVRVTSREFGADPAPDEQKHLSFQYKPCEAWERDSFDASFKQMQLAAEAERAALRRAVKQQRDRELDFEDEQQWVKPYTKAHSQRAASEVLDLAVGIGRRERVCVKRSTLALCAESALARKFNPQAPAAAVAPAVANADGSTDDDSSDEEPDANTIEEGVECFRRLINQLRLIAIASPGDPPPPPQLREHEEAPFAKLLDTYFKGVEDFILTNGEHRLAGTKRRAAGRMLFQFEAFTFLPIVHETRNGPTLAEMQAAYAGQPWLGEHFTMGAHQGYQVWTVPADGRYRVVAEGAQGGGGGMGRNANQYGAAGAKVEGTFEFSKGQQLTIVVGVCGGSSGPSNGGSYSGGGGGSFVVSAEGEPLLVAGGGGAACGTSHGNNLTATDNGAGRKEREGGTAGPNGYTGNGGQNGGGGQSGGGGSYRGSGGGGFHGDGADGQNHADQTSGGRSFASGLRGGQTDGANTNYNMCGGPELGHGGFGGGGGGGHSGPGGGGGYSGGGATGHWDTHSGYGGGGGSFNAGAEQVNVTGGARRVQAGAHQLADGSVTVTLLK